MMEVILLERIEKLGQMGDVVNVRPGFARNYLLPQKKALRATDSNRAEYESQRTQLETNNLEQRKEAEKVAVKFDGLSITIVRQASDNDQLYGSVTVRNIAQSITEAGYSVDSKQVQMGRPIKTVGMHPVIVKLHPEVSVTITANVARTEDEALAQLEGRSLRPDDDLDEETAFGAEDSAAESTEAGDDVADAGDAAAEPDVEEESTAG
jgi:large subunit ribosomal protein L9